VTLERIQPAGLRDAQTYSHVVAASGTRLVFVAGQVAEVVRGDLVGPDDMGAQARQAFANVGRALAAGGARPEQVAKITIFVVGLRAAHLEPIEQARVALFGAHRPADSLVGVEALAHPGCLIEVEAVAVVDGA
jgi:enamine deaminase RidA (YjgF/YER057c/UK114 family)